MLRQHAAMQIRRAEIADDEALANIRRNSILDLSRTVPDVSAAEAEKWAMGVAPDRIARAIREHEVWVAVEEIPIGWVEIESDRVAGLYVAPLFSSKGVGSRLLLLAEEAIAKAGYASARLEASRNALDFYLRRGYVRAGDILADGSFPLTKDLCGLSRQ